MVVKWNFITKFLYRFWWEDGIVCGIYVIWKTNKKEIDL